MTEIKSNRKQGKEPYDKIPILDMAPYLEGKPGALEKIGKEVQKIQESIGFWAVVNHGVSSDVIEKTYIELKKFFALPYEIKAQYKINHLSIGYVPPKSTRYVTSIINENTEKDLNETLITALERPKDHPLIIDGTRFVGPNQWPKEVPELRNCIIEYQKQIRDLGLKLLPIFAVALDLDSNYFDQYFNDPVMWTRNAHYPPEKAKKNQYGIAPHSDHSFLTMLPITDVPGLQILTQKKKWIDAEYIENGILVNTGEFLNRWSNGRFIPTPHRVIPPERDRFSMATFFNPSPNSVSEPLKTCVSSDNPPMFEPMTLMDYLCWYIDTNYERDAGGKQ